MKCPFCDYNETKVLDSRPVGDGNSVRRRRECLECGARFTTYERYEDNKVRVVKKDGSREEFDRNKILNGLIKSCEKRPVSSEQIEEIVGRIEDKVKKSGKHEIQSTILGDLVIEELQKIDKVSYVRYASVYKEFRDIDSFLDLIKDLKKN